MMTGLVLMAAGFAAAQETNYVELNRLAKQFQARSFAQKMDAQMTATRLGLPLRIDNPRGGTLELMRFEKGRPIYFATDNLVAADSIATSKLWPGGSSGLNLTGAGILLREWDGGSARESHQEFGGRVAVMDGGALNFHATHVAGTMVAAGMNPSARGGAFEANLSSWDWNDDTAEMAVEAANGMQISNHSYGQITGWTSGNFGAGSGWYWWGNPGISTTEDYNFGIYNQLTRDWDLIANNAPYYLPFKSGGNDRLQGPNSQPTGWYWNGSAWTPNPVARDKDGGPGGYDSIGDMAGAKNTMVIAAVNDVPGGWSSPASVGMSSFSSWGPTDDGRIKPDISTNGVGLFSTWHTGDDQYDSISGTSMATPSASGSAGLLARQYEVLHGQQMLASTLRGLIIHSADECGPSNGPDYAFGWGLMNTARAAQIINDFAADDGLIREATLNNAQTLEYTYPSNGATPFKVTIAWNDPAASATGDVVDDPTIKLVNDLDVRVSKGATTYMPWTLNPANPAEAASTGDNIRDNVEVIEIPAPEAGDYTVTISHKGALAAGSQVVSVIVTGSSNTLPTVQSLTLSPTIVKGGSPSQATLTLSAPAPAGGAVVNLTTNNAAATLPSTVTVPASQSSVVFTVNTKRVSASQVATITGAYNSSSAGADLTIRPPHVIGLTVSPNPQNGGSNSVGTVQIDVTAPVGGMVVTLTSSNAATASVPVSVVVPAGATSANFNVNCGLVLVNSNATITAKIETTQKSVVLQVLASLVSFEVKSIIPSGATITSGNLDSLKTSNDNYLVWSPLNLNMKFIALDMLGTGEANLKQLNFVVEVRGDALVDYKVEAYNFTKKSWVTIGNIPATTTDMKVTLPLSAPNSYVNTGNFQIRSRITGGPRKGAPANWTSSIDQAIWTAQK